MFRNIVKKLSLFLIFIVAIISCIKDDPEPANSPYSFFIAGHTYGKPGVDNEGVHPPFKDKFPLIQNDNYIKFGFFLGDIVKQATVKNWDEIDEDIVELGLPVYFAAGNHDIGDRELYEQRYGDTYYSFLYENDLFIVIDPNLDSWNISGDQLNFLVNTVDSNYENCNNIFVLSHQLLWWTQDNQFQNIHLNSLSGQADTTNFWSTIEPIFHNIPNNVIFCAGDIGANSSDGYMYYHYDNITFIATGMGSTINDNFIIISLMEDSIQYKIIALEGDEDRFGNLEDYVLP